MDSQSKVPPITCRHIWIAAIFGQLILLAVHVFGDFGFDHPSQSGLSFNHQLFFAFLYVATLFAGIVSSYIDRKWLATIFQLLLPFLIIAFLARPAPHYDAAEHQDLIGKTYDEVARRVSFRNALQGSRMTDDGEVITVSLNGMSIYFSTDWVVVTVESTGYEQLGIE